MSRVLLLPSSDYLGHPFPQRHNQIFDRLHLQNKLDVHVLRLCLFDREQLISCTHIHKLPDIPAKRLSMYYLINMLFHGKYICDVVKKISADAVVLSNIAPALGYNFLKNNTVPAVFDLPDYFPTSAAGYIADTSSSVGGLITGVFSAMLKWLVKRCKTVTVASIALKKYAESLGASKVVYVPNGIGEHFFELHDGRAVREKFGFEDDDIVVGYLGSMEFWLDMEPLLEAVRISVKRGLPVKLLLVGKELQTNYIDRIYSWVNEKGLKEHVIMTGFVPYEEVPYYISAMDLTTIPFNVNNPTAWYAGPNKLWEYLSQCKPVLATPIPDVKINSDYVEVVSNGDDYYNSIARYSKDRTLFIEKAREGLRKARTRTWERSAVQMHDVLCSLESD